MKAARIANIEEAERRMKENAYVTAYTRMAQYILNELIQRDDIFFLDDDDVLSEFLDMRPNEVERQAAINGFTEMLADLEQMAEPGNIHSIVI